VTPNMTSTHGPATRGRRRSRGSRRGLPATSSLIATILPCPPRREAGRGPPLDGPRTRAAPSPGPPQCSRSDRRRQFSADRLEQLLPGCRELGHALLFQDGHHVPVADAEGLEVHEELPRLRVAAAAGVAP